MSQARSESWFEDVERELDRMNAASWAEDREQFDERDREIHPADA